MIIVGRKTYCSYHLHQRQQAFLWHFRLLQQGGGEAYIGVESNLA